MTTNDCLRLQLEADHLTVFKLMKRLIKQI